MGYYGTFYGTPCVAVPQRHKIGSTEFVMDDDVLTIIAGDDKPIKVKSVLLINVNSLLTQRCV